MIANTKNYSTVRKRCHLALQNTENMASSSHSAAVRKLPEKFHPGKSFNFRKRTFGKKNEERSFRAEWCEKYPWLHYNIESDSAFCHLCMTADYESKFLVSTKRDAAFISRGFTYWKEATTAFAKHQASECHREASEALILLPKQIQADVGELLSQEHKEEKATNRKMFLKILENIRFLSRQGLPLRGGNGDADSNFIQLLRLRGIDCPEIEAWMKKKTNKYTSHDIQNECLQIMALQILREVSQSVRDSGCYSIMADECTDIANKEQFTIIIRWVGEDLQDHEDFIGLYEVGSITAESLVHAIQDVLLRMKVKLSECRGQCYDGASNMSGSRNGVATQIMAEEKSAVYTHCYGHALNLAVGDAIKQSKVCCDALETAFEISKLVKFSPKRNAAFDRIKADMTEEESHIRVGIRSFCPTRWTVRGDSVASILDNYNVLHQLWEECLDTTLVPEVKCRMLGVRAQMSQYNLLFGLKLCERILRITDNLSRTLQKQSLSAAEAQHIAALTVKTLKDMRTDEAFGLFFEQVELLRNSTDTEGPSLPRKRKAPKDLEVDHGDAHHSPTIQEQYRRQYLEAIDMAYARIQVRFDQPGYAIYCNLESLLLKAANQENYSVELQKVISFYGNDFDESELSTQLQIFGTNFAREAQPSKITLQEAFTFLRTLSEGQRAFFRQVCFIARLILVMPATNAASERTFSTMRRIKSYLRSTMGQARLNHLMVLSIYKEMLDGIDLHTTANNFVQGSEHRLCVFGKF